MIRRVFLPCAALAPYIRNYMAGGFARTLVHLPATADVQLVFYRQGGTTLLGQDGAAQRLPPVLVAGASFAPRLFRVDPGSSFVAVTFRPSGVLACLGLPASELTGRLLRLDDLVAPGAAQSVLQRLQDAGQAASMAAILDAYFM